MLDMGFETITPVSNLKQKWIYTVKLKNLKSHISILISNNEEAIKSSVTGFN
jgi:hypothetical protein